MEPTLREEADAQLLARIVAGIRSIVHLESEAEIENDPGLA